MKDIENWTTKDVVLYSLAILAASVLTGVVLGWIFIAFFASLILSW